MSAWFKRFIQRVQTPRPGGQEHPSVLPDDGLTSDQPRPKEPTSARKSFDTEKVVGNILALSSGEVVARVVAFVAISYLARELGPAGYGIIAFALALSGYLSLAVHAGFDEIGARTVASRPYEASSIAASVILVRMMLAFAAFATIGVVALFLDKPTTMKLVVVLSGLSFFYWAFDTSWAYKGLERNRWIGLALVLGQVLFLGMVLIVVRGPGDVVFVPLAQFLGDISAALFLAVFLFRLRKIKLGLREGWKVLRSSGFLTLSRVLRTLILTFDIVLVGFMLGEREVGLYAAPYRFCILLAAIAIATQVSYLPVFTRTRAQGSKQMADLARRSAELTCAISAPMTVGGMIVAAPLIYTLFGPGYLEGAAAFRLVILSIGFAFISGVTHNVLLVHDRLNVEVWIIAVAAALNIGLNVVVIPRYGIVGAGFTTALAEGLILLLGLLAVYRMGIRLDLRPMLRPLLAAGVMGAVLIAIGTGHGLALYLGVGLIIYVLALFILRGIPQDVQPHLGRLPSVVSGLRGRLR